MQFLRRYGMRVVVGVALLIVANEGIRIYATYRQSLWVEQKAESVGGAVTWEFSGPSWIPDRIAKRLVFLNRVQYVDVTMRSAPLDLLAEVRSLKVLRSLNLISAKVTDEGMTVLHESDSLEIIHLSLNAITDAGVEPLKRMPRLKEISLDRMNITDAALEHLKGLANLEVLDLDYTQTTPEGRAKLRKALPNCMITPNP